MADVRYDDETVNMEIKLDTSSVADILSETESNRLSYLSPKVALAEAFQSSA